MIHFLLTIFDAIVIDTSGPNDQSYFSSYFCQLMFSKAHYGLISFLLAHLHIYGPIFKKYYGR